MGPTDGARLLMKSWSVESNDKMTATEVGGNQIQCVSRFSKVEGDASQGSHRVVVPMDEVWDVQSKVQHFQSEVRHVRLRRQAVGTQQPAEQMPEVVAEDGVEDGIGRRVDIRQRHE